VKADAGKLGNLFHRPDGEPQKNKQGPGCPLWYLIAVLGKFGASSVFACPPKIQLAPIHDDRSKLVSIHKWLFSPISLLGGNFNPRNISHMPAVKISARLQLDDNISFLDGHELSAESKEILHEKNKKPL
jgi:hypothetical protein